MSLARFRSLVVLVVPAIVLASGCDGDTTTGPPEGDGFGLEPGYALLADGTEVTLSAEAEAFAPGAEVTLVLDNQASEQVGFNLCFHALERRDGDEWTHAEEQDDRICTTVLHLLDPGDSATYGTTLPSALPAGEYRFRVALYLLDREDHRDIVTPSFGIGGG